jgi:hypothetical protein
VKIALRNTKTTVHVSKLQEIYLPDDQVIDLYTGHDTDFFGACNDGNHRPTLADADGDDKDGVAESTTLGSDCIDFGLRALPHGDVLNYQRYSAHDTIIPRTKELVSLVDASKLPEGRGDIVADALDKMIAIEKANIASENPPLRGALVSGCPVGKLRKTNVSSLNF